MCWRSKEIPVKRTATSELVVYKFVTFKDGGLFSPYRGTPFPLSTTFHAPDFGDVERVMGGFDISFGYHSYLPEKTLLDVGDDSVIISNEVTGITSAWFDEDCCGETYLIKCLLPAGSKYYVNESGEVVSDTIVSTNDFISVGEMMFKKIDNPFNLFG